MPQPRGVAPYPCAMRRPGRGTLAGWVPGIALARGYERSWLRHDLVSGLVLTALLVPQGMAYAQLAGLDPVMGLYATLVPLLVYVVLGPSRILVLGPDSALAPLVLAAIVPLAAVGAPAERVPLAGMLALLVGGFCVVAGLARFGFLTDLISKPVRMGYLTGIALTVIAIQLAKLFGFPGGGDELISSVRSFVEGIDETDWLSLLVGVGTLAVILVLRRIFPPFPGVFIAVAGATIASWALDLSERGVSTVGALPEGLPELAWPSVSAHDLGALTLAAAGIAFVAFTDTSVLSRSYSWRLKQEVDQNQELVALGAANVLTGLFQGFPISSSSSRTAVAETTGSRSQMTGLVAAIGLGLVLLVATGLVEDMPQPALAAVVMAAVLGLVDVAGFRRLSRARRSEFILATTAFLGVALLGVLWGIAVAVGLSLLNFVRRAWRPHDAILGRVHGLKGYHDLERHPQAQQVPGLVLYRFDAPLFFANADYFREQIRLLVSDPERPVAWVVVCAEPMTDIDSTAGEILEGLLGELGQTGVELAFAELKDPVRDRLRRYGLHDRIGDGRFFPTIGVAVRAYVEATGVSWRDWEDGGKHPVTDGGERPPRT